MKMLIKKSRIAHDVVVGDIPARPTKGIAKDLRDTSRVDSGSDSWRIISLRSGYCQGENQATEEHCKGEGGISKASRKGAFAADKLSTWSCYSSTCCTTLSTANPSSLLWDLIFCMVLS